MPTEARAVSGIWLPLVTPWRDDRLDEISSAILVPLTTTVACSISSRTIWPSRKSVGCGVCAAAPDRALFGSRSVEALPMPRLCANRGQTTNRLTALSP